VCVPPCGTVETASRIPSGGGVDGGGLQKRRGVSIRPVARDAEIMAAIKRMGLLTSQLEFQVLAFSLDNYTACKRPG